MHNHLYLCNDPVMLTAHFEDYDCVSLLVAKIERRVKYLRKKILVNFEQKT